MVVNLKTQAQQSLRDIWGYSSFRSGQDEAIYSVLEGKNTLVLFPTGGGKSLCYQVPAMVLNGLTIVISPLISLMEDQVKQLNERDIAATFINSTISSWEVEQRLVNARNDMYDLLYCSPERLKTNLWEAELPKLNIDLIAIDEAHCISEWGHDFRPTYREIRPSLEAIADEITWIALTATATPEVRDDIIHNLEFDDPVIISKGFERPNLKWWVTQTEQKEKKLFEAIKKAASKGSGLVYGGTRRNCEDLATKIEQQLNIATKAYHAGVESKIRKQVQQEWLSDSLPLVVATNAFGMGIDKADCRYVVHYQMPYSLESYYQESGRAGRDGEESFPLLLFQPADVKIAKKRIKDSYPQKEQLQHVYDVLCDQLNLAMGSEMEQAEEVSVKALKKRAGFSTKIVRSSLKVLNHLGVLTLTEYIIPQIGIQFLVSQDYLLDYTERTKNKQKAMFVDTLFRQYGAEALREIIYHEFDYIKQKLEVSPNGLKKGLLVLQNYDQLLQFKIIGELPLVKLTEERHSSLMLSKDELEMHRNTLLKKLEYMNGYIQTDTCREVYIRRYFGEDDVSPCGHCDNCLKRNISKPVVSDSEIRNVQNILSDGGKEFNQICKQSGWSKFRTKYFLSYLIREEKVTYEAEKYVWNE